MYVIFEVVNKYIGAKSHKIESFPTFPIDHINVCTQNIIITQNTHSYENKLMPARKIKRVEEDPNDKDDEMWNYYDVCKHYWLMDG